MTAGKQKARLVLQDGSVFPGEVFGASQATAGEVGEYLGDLGIGGGVTNGRRMLG